MKNEKHILAENPVYRTHKEVVRLKKCLKCEILVFRSSIK